MTIKQTIQKEQVIEKEITLPYFCKDENKWFKITEDKSVVYIYNNGNTHTTISKTDYWIQSSDISKCSQITEGEFNQAYHEALMEIGKYVPAPEVPFELVK